VARAIETDETARIRKVLLDPATERILGASIVGAEAGELIHVFAALMQAVRHRNCISLTVHTTGSSPGRHSPVEAERLGAWVPRAIPSGAQYYWPVFS